MFETNPFVSPVIYKDVFVFPNKKKKKEAYFGAFGVCPTSLNTHVFEMFFGAKGEKRRSTLLFQHYSSLAGLNEFKVSERGGEEKAESLLNLVWPRFFIPVMELWLVLERHIIWLADKNQVFWIVAILMI